MQLKSHHEAQFPMTFADEFLQVCNHRATPQNSCTSALSVKESQPGSKVSLYNIQAWGGPVPVIQETAREMNIHLWSPLTDYVGTQTLATLVPTAIACLFT